MLQVATNGSNIKASKEQNKYSGSVVKTKI